MAWTHWRRLLSPTWLLIGATLSASDCELGVGPVGAGPAETNPPQVGPPRPWSGLAVMVEVRPNLSSSLGEAFGSIRALHSIETPSGIGTSTYLDSLRVHSFVSMGDSIVAMNLAAGEGEAGHFSVTVIAPGYVAWDTTGVSVGVRANRLVSTEQLSVQLVETP